MGISFINSKVLHKKLFLKRLKIVEGQISENEQLLLYKYAKNTPGNTSIVEVGSFRGKSTICLGLGSQEGNNNTVYAIDPHNLFIGVNGGKFGPNDLDAFYRNIVKFRLGNIVRQISLSSCEVGKIWNQTIGLLWLDGDHSYQGVKQDVELFTKHLSPGGFLLFHDSYLESVQSIIDELVETESYTLTERVNTITALEKIK